MNMDDCYVLAEALYGVFVQKIVAQGKGWTVIPWEDLGSVSKTAWAAVAEAVLSDTVPQSKADWHKTSEDTAFARPFGTIRVCLGCGCLVTGGPTRCVRCA